MSGGYDVDAGVLESVTSRLRGRSATLEGSAKPPPAPEAGACSASIAAAVGFFAESVGGVVEGVDSMGGAVERCNASYGRDDAHAGDVFAGLTFPG